MDLDSRKSPESLAVLVLGTDTIIEALPARPIQLAHACGSLGFDLVIPPSWGDELVAEGVLRILESRAPAPAILCTCPLVRRRLLLYGTDLAGSLVSVVAPPIAIARHLRSSLVDRLGSLTFAGRCPSAGADAYDAVYDPAALFEIMRSQGIQLSDQPDAFVDRLPPDRRRFVSLPGGCPSPEMLWQRCNEMTLVEVDENESEMAIEIAQRLISPEPCLVDIAASSGCHCSGITHSVTGSSARLAVASLEPPRATTPVLSEGALPDLFEAVSVAQNGMHSREAASYRPPMAVTPPSALRTRI